MSREESGCLAAAVGLSVAVAADVEVFVEAFFWTHRAMIHPPPVSTIVAFGGFSRDLRS